MVEPSEGDAQQGRLVQNALTLGSWIRSHKQTRVQRDLVVLMSALVLKNRWSEILLEDFKQQQIEVKPRRMGIRSARHDHC